MRLFTSVGLALALSLFGSGCSSSAASKVSAAPPSSTQAAPGGSVATLSHTSPSATAPSTPPSVRYGQPVRYADQDGSADITVSAPRTAKPSQYTTVNGSLYEVTVSISGISGIYSPNAMLFVARSAAGDSYPAQVAAVNGELGIDTVATGQKSRGNVAFDVPKGQTISTVLLSYPVDGQKGSWS